MDHLLVCFVFIVATPLTLNDLGHLKALLQPVAAYWQALADQLEMTGLVPIIENTSKNNTPTNCLRDLLNRWLNREQPTVEKLCQALRADDEIIGGAGIAKKLEEEFKRRCEISNLVYHSPF